MMPQPPASGPCVTRSRNEIFPIGPAAAILIDLRGVLYDDTILSRWLFRLVSHMGSPLQYASFWETWQREYEQDVKCGQRDAVEAQRASSWFRTDGQIDETITAGDSRRRQFEASIRPLPGIKAAVAQLDASVGSLEYSPIRRVMRARSHNEWLIWD